MRAGHHQGQKEGHNRIRELNVYIYGAIIFLGCASVGPSKHSICAFTANSTALLLSSISFTHGFLKGLNKMNFIAVLLNNFGLC